MPPPPLHPLCISINALGVYNDVYSTSFIEELHQYVIHEGILVALTPDLTKASILMAPSY